MPYQPVKKPRANSKREAILKAAMKVFCHYGYDGATLDKIADEAGVSKALIIRFFESKHNVLVICLERFMDDFTRKIERNAAKPGMTYPNHVDFLFNIFKLNRAEFRLLIAVMATPAHADIATMVYPRHLSIVQSMMDNFCPECPPERRSALNHTIYTYLVSYILGGNEDNFRRTMDLALRLFLDQE